MTTDERLDVLERAEEHLRRAIDLIEEALGDPDDVSGAGPRLADARDLLLAGGGKLGAAKKFLRPGKRGAL